MEDTANTNDVNMGTTDDELGVIDEVTNQVVNIERRPNSSTRYISRPSEVSLFFPYVHASRYPTYICMCYVFMLLLIFQLSIIIMFIEILGINISLSSPLSTIYNRIPIMRVELLLRIFFQHYLLLMLFKPLLAHQ